jgi:hypothetical protein
MKKRQVATTEVKMSQLAEHFVLNVLFDLLPCTPTQWRGGRWPQQKSKPAWAQIAGRIFNPDPDPSPDLNPDPYCYCVQYTCTLRKSVHENMLLMIGNEVIKFLFCFHALDINALLLGIDLHEF